MKAIPQGLNIDLMHDFGADSLGRDHLYTQTFSISMPTGLFCAQSLAQLIRD